MTSPLYSLVDLVSAYPAWAYATVFCAALLEAVPVLGSFVPGSTVILGLSAVIATGGLKLVPMLASAFAGAVIGDGAAYWVGHRSKRQILEAWPLKNYPTVIARSEEFFAGRGTLAVFLARFIPPVRAFVPVTAGALDMPPQRFFPVNIVAIALWAPLHVVPGLLAGSALKQWGTSLHHHLAALALAAAAVAVVALAIWQYRHRADNLGDRIKII
ncbi:DedA family protein [Bradyrhizobium sp. U87765 SZCCT0131]|uniref:DedA family protein n=1 Tax=unclassified Bradyrhizobium TaxID=2631580 RepID=UPI001BA62BDB|nr:MULTISPECIES: DedA family protein [unclassified Bradyrhizobium]MBR1217140.1 DedA family protein [Bradyrhizobium sp. U87765 SZCCT0131]MBR1259104.1 DedA family protein [Bradyrhizobium sp. U87765 SZCCT0134]MBR1305245.1 DedA family protein [Bradyrhizobium sp. U87765 SZCCT0110]MBR1321031.1 DedA family protein [Bradyrhizobium sp. U87765 SZCCT0109]MBR1350315.1 DedA family protein [Bradyrhizobium sp. U87765 SZCCT0048]